MINHVLLGACGLYCGACNHYRASSPEGKHLLAAAAKAGRPAEGFTCGGCRSEKLYIHKGCAECGIRACAESRGIGHCGECAELPCEKLAAFRDDGHIHHLDIYVKLNELRRVGAEAWLAAQAERWTCACGAPFSWYEGECANCSRWLDSYHKY
jgi:hypothetical protein